MNSIKSFNKNENIIFFLFFLFFVFFFLFVHPIILFSSDDWTYLYLTRYGVPDSSLWNPTRVLPEILMPLCSDFAISFIYPFNKDFFASLTLVFAIVVSASIAFYIYSFCNLLKKTIKTDKFNIICISLGFVFLHFLIFHIENANNQHLFFSDSPTNYFFYTIPNCMCSIWGFLVLKEGNVTSLWNTLSRCKKGLFILFTYLCILSNLFPNTIIISLVSSIIAINFVETFFIKKTTSIILFLKNNRFDILVLTLWGIVALFELAGGRASQVTNDKSLYALLAESFGYLKEFLSKTNKNVFYLLGGIVIAIIYIKLFYTDENKKRKIIRTVLSLLFAAIISFPLTILLCSKSIPIYITRADVLFVIITPIIYSAIILLYAIATEIKNISICLPLFIFLLMSKTISEGRTFRDTHDKVPYYYRTINKDTFSQIEKGVSQNRDTIAIYMPYEVMKDGWPTAEYHGERMTNALRKYGIISPDMTIEVRPTYQK